MTGWSTARGRIMPCLCRLLLFLLLFPALGWGQSSVLNGNRIHAGWTNYGTTAGTATAYTLTFTPAMPGYAQGQCFLLKPHVTNTGAATLNVQGKGALSLTKESSGSLVPLVAGDLLLNRLVMACHDGTNLQLIGAAPDASAVGVTDGDKQDITVSSAGTVWTIDPGAVTYSKLQNVSQTDRLLGRDTPGAGSAEELTPAAVKTMLGLTFGDLTGDLPYTALTPATAASRLLGCGLAAGAGDWQEVTLGTNLSMSGTTLSAAGTAGVPDGDKGDVTVSGTGTIWTLDPGTVTYAKLQPASAASRLLGRSSTGAGDWQEVTLGANLAMSGTTLNASGAGGVPDGDKGDVTVSGTGATWTIDPATVTYAKLQNVSVTGRLLGRNTAGAGSVEELTATTVKAMLGITFGDLSGTATPAQLPNAASDGVTKGVVTFSATDLTCTAGVCTLASNAVTLAKLADIPTASLLGRDDPATGDPEVLTPTQVKVMLGLEQVTNRSDADMFVLAKKLENTRLKPRVLQQENAAAITIDSTSFSVVKIAELLQDTTFPPPTGSPDLEDTLLLEICTTARRTLTFSTATNGFSPGHGLALPTTNDPGTCVKHLFAWNGSKWSLNSSTQTTTRGVALQVWTSGGPLAEPGWATPSAGGGGTVGERFLPVTAVGFPATNAARVEYSGNSHKLLYDNATQWCAFWGPFRMNPDYASAPVLKIDYSMFSVTTSTVTMRARVMAITPGTDAHDPDNDANYDAVNTCPASTVPGTAGVPATISCPLTSTDGLLARDLTKIELCRNTGGAAGMMEVLAVSLEYTK